MKKFFIFLLLFIFLLTFKEWFSPVLISGGDFPNFTKLSYERINLMPYAWGVGVSTLGGYVAPLSWNHFINSLPIIVGKTLGINWIFIQRIFYLFPLLISLFIVPLFVFRKFFPSSKFYIFATIIFSLNTYILMVIGGGQIFLGLSYSLIPLVFYFLSKTFSKPIITSSLITAFLFSLQVMFDLRIAYVTILGFVIFLLLNYSKTKAYLKSLVFSFFIPMFLSFLFNLYWILPTILTKGASQSFGQEYLSSSIIPFLSFASFSNAFSLLHPNWPENIFGKVYFMRPEFLILPILAFSGLFFRKDKRILFFSLLGIVGAFLAKGANQPFGQVYSWMFNHVPGFIMFRDPTKWYSFVALSYSILIPFSISEIYGKFKDRKQVGKVFVVLIFFYLLFLIRPAFLGQLNGTFKSTKVPNDYLKFENFLGSQKEFSRTFWLPSSQRFSYYSDTHPIVSGDRLFGTNDPKKSIKFLKKSENLMQDLSVRYVVIPYDSEGEIFLSDRKYSQKLYEQTVNQVRNISWLRQMSGFGKIAVFEVPNQKDHFWSQSENLKIKYQYINPAEYKVQVQDAKKDDILVFSEGFDPNWTAESSGFKINSSEFAGRLNSFKLPKKGNYEFNVYYEPQKYVEAGLWVSGLSIFIALAFFFSKYFKK